MTTACLYNCWTGYGHDDGRGNNLDQDQMILYYSCYRTYKFNKANCLIITQYSSKTAW